jgi:flagellar hook-basal body complex protein FliE
MRVAPTSLEWDKTIQDKTAKASPTSASSFAEELKAKMYEADQFQHRADQAMQEGAVKGAENIHESMIKLEEADLSLRLLMKVRNKALDAYQEVMRMQF